MMTANTSTEIITAKQLFSMVNLQDPLQQGHDLVPLQPGLGESQHLPGDGLVVDGHSPLEDVLLCRENLTQMSLGHCQIFQHDNSEES